MSQIIKIKKDSSTMLFIGGSKDAYRCHCGANVFHRLPDADDNHHYECNGCHATYSAPREPNDPIYISGEPEVCTLFFKSYDGKIMGLAKSEDWEQLVELGRAMGKLKYTVSLFQGDKPLEMEDPR